MFLSCVVFFVDDEARSFVPRQQHKQHKNQPYGGGGGVNSFHLFAARQSDAITLPYFTRKYGVQMFEERDVTPPNLLVRAHPEIAAQIFRDRGEPGQQAVEHGDQGGSAHRAFTCCSTSSSEQYQYHL